MVKRQYKKDFKNYYQNLVKQIKQHLSAERIEKVIVTDTFKWEFYDKTIDSHEEIVLVDRIPSGRGYKHEWKNDADSEFQKLKEKLQEFLKVSSI